MDEMIYVPTDADRENSVKATIKRRVEKYMDTTIQSIEVNSNIGTPNPDDYLILIYLSWSTKNGVDRTRTMLEMYSDDMAATLASKYIDASDIILFWEVPYLLKNGTCAKYSYDVRNGSAYQTEKTGPLYR